jgi:hypothetical protein
MWGWSILGIFCCAYKSFTVDLSSSNLRLAPDKLKLANGSWFLLLFFWGFFLTSDELIGCLFFLRVWSIDLKDLYLLQSS